MRPFVRRIAAAVTAAAALVAPTLSTSPAFAEDVNPYTTPGEHMVNGRQWSTDCELYTAKIWRCTTDIWASTVIKRNGAYVTVQKWVFNNLTYLGSPRSDWAANPMGSTGEWESNGRKWRTECDTEATGANACRSYIWASVITRNGAGQYGAVQKWVFNNIVNLGSDYGQPTRVPLPYTERVLVGTSVEGRKIYAYQVGDPNATDVKMVLG